MPLPKSLTSEQLAEAAQRMRERDRAHCRRYYHKNLEQERRRQRAYVAKNRDVVNARWRASYVQARDGATEAYQRRRRRVREARQRERMACLVAYGGPICRCCGETELIFLALDHIKEDGAAHRRAIGSGARNLYCWLIKNQFPPEFQVLCHNCNVAKSLGGCPHQLRGTHRMEGFLASA